MQPRKMEVRIRAICELHSIEMDIFNLWIQLPDLDVMDQTKQTHKQANQEAEVPAIFDIEDLNGVETVPDDSWIDWLQCDGCKRWWSSRELLNYHKERSTNAMCAHPNVL